MSRFVILTHDHPFPHWDLLLENGETCRTWRLLESPERSKREIAAEELDNHRLMYLDYEGPVSGQRGAVSRWDTGTFEWITNSADLCEMQMEGEQWQGIVRLMKHERRSWVCILEWNRNQPTDKP